MTKIIPSFGMASYRINNNFKRNVDKNTKMIDDRSINTDIVESIHIVIPNTPYLDIKAW